jgi:hypothetical protein
MPIKHLKHFVNDMWKNFEKFSLEFDNEYPSNRLGQAIRMIQLSKPLGSLNGPTLQTANQFELVCYWFSNEHL